jgi:hypothetical protein
MRSLGSAVGEARDHHEVLGGTLSALAPPYPPLPSSKPLLRTPGLEQARAAAATVSPPARAGWAGGGAPTLRPCGRCARCTLGRRRREEGSARPQPRTWPPGRGRGGLRPPACLPPRCGFPPAPHPLGRDPARCSPHPAGCQPTRQTPHN